MKRVSLIKLLSICASPVLGSSTEILLDRIAQAVAENAGAKCRHTMVRLNDLDILDCQACGEAPTPKFCFFDDDMTRLYRQIVECDCLLFGSPIYFDTVSAQAKRFIDRCNCIRPPDYAGTDPDHDFLKLVTRKSSGAIVLVGGEQAWFEGARRTVAGLFKWIGVANEAQLFFGSTDFNRAGEVVDSFDTLKKADQVGHQLARSIRKRNG